MTAALTSLLQAAVPLFTKLLLIPAASVTFLQKPFDVNDLTRVLRETPEHV